MPLPPTRSWLAEADSIHDLGNHFYVPKAGTEWDERRDARAEARWLERLRRPLPRAVETPGFYGSAMHDSWLLGVERTDDALRVTLDSINADIFSIGLADALGVTPSSDAWPVDLLLNGPVYVRAARYDPAGTLRFADPYRIPSRREPHYALFHGEDPQEAISAGWRRRSVLPQFLYDWFFEEDGRLQWIAGIWVGSHTRERLSTSTYLMVDCVRASAVDRRREALVAAYGPAAGPLWDDALAGVDVGDAPYGPWSVPTMAGFLQRRMAAYGLARADFLPAAAPAPG